MPILRGKWLMAITAAHVACALAHAEAVDTRPNILWITSEDNSVDWVGCYGNPHAETPNIDAMAAEGFQYMHCYANAPVCSPSRSTWITGMLAISNGTFPMRSSHKIPHDRIPYYPDLLRKAGYYVANDKKNDFNIGGRKASACWDRNDKVDWNALTTRQPFFQVINLYDSHESKAQGDVSNTIHNPADTRLRAYHPDLPDIRKNYAKYHDAVKRMDTEVGNVLKKLEDLGLSDSTIIIYNSDHGGVLPRSKRFLFSTGLHCPLIVRIPDKFKDLWPVEQPGSQIDRLVSFVDMPKTWLSLAGAEISDTMQGTIFLGKETEPEPQYHFAFRGRMDERLENARALTNKRYLYIRNYMPYVPWMQHLQYLWKMRATQAWDDHVKSGKASELESRFFGPKGFSEELYDLKEDSDNVTNLAELPEYGVTLQRMREALRSEQLRVYDAGLLPETEMIRRAAQNNLTIYEMARDPALYGLPALLDAADLALGADKDNLSALEKLLESPDCGMRYWGIVGCFLLNTVPDRIDAMLEDESHEVRIMAAWLWLRAGNKERGFSCLKALIEENGYAMLTSLNAIDWIGPEAQQLVGSIPDEGALDGYVKRMRDWLLMPLVHSRENTGH